MSRPNPSDITDLAQYQAALAALLALHGSVRQIARVSGVSKTTVAQIMSRSRLPHQATIDLVVSRLDPDRRDQWLSAWRRIKAEQVDVHRSSSREATSDTLAANASRPGPVARELPAALSSLTGREDALATLDGHVQRYNRDGEANVVAIVGMAGVGKTALALSWGHRHHAEFPDGSFYLDLRGYAPMAPIPVADALAVMLRKLGVNDVDHPAGEDERSALYRSLLSTRRALVILDNAENTEHIRLLMPGQTESLIVITARDALRAAHDLQEVLRVELRVLSDEASIQLLRELSDDQPSPVSTIRAVAGHCGNLPLALRIAAGLAAERSSGLIAVGSELADESIRLDLLDSGDARAAMRSVLSWSFRHLDDDVYRAFRLLGVGLMDDVDHYIVAALAGCRADAGRRHIRTLIQARLLQEHRPGRYTMHNLLRDLAREQATEIDPPGSRTDALGRLRAFYLHGAYRVRRQIGPLCSDPLLSAPDTPDLPEIDDPSAAEAWFAAEQTGILAMVVEAASEGDHPWVCRIADAVWWLLFAAGRHSISIWLHETALHSAEEWGRPEWAARALEHLGIAEQLLGRYPDALRHGMKAVEYSRKADDRALEARASSAVGSTYARLGDHPKSIDWFRRALEAAEQQGDEPLQARVWNNLGLVYQRWGRFREALVPLDRGIAMATRLEETYLLAVGLNNRSLVLRRLDRQEEAQHDVSMAREISAAIGDKSLLREVLDSLGSLLLEDGRPTDALEPLRQALRMHREAGDRAAEAETLDNLGTARCHLGDPRAAADHHEEAIRLSEEIGDAGRRVSALLGSAAAYRLLGARELAADRFSHALHISGELNNTDQQARAMKGLAQLRLDEGKTAEAHRLLKEALRLYDDLDLSDAEEIRGMLSSLSLDRL